MSDAPENKGNTGRWQKGQSGNPGGRPRVARLSKALREILAQPSDSNPNISKAEELAAAMYTKAVKGDARTMAEIADRTEGKARQTLDITNQDLRDRFGKMSANEMREYAESGKLPAWWTELDATANTPTIISTITADEESAG